MTQHRGATTTLPDTPPAAQRGPRGRWRAAIYAAWFAVVALTIGLVMAGFPTMIKRAAQTAAEYEGSLRQLGLPAGFVGWYQVALDLIPMMVFFGIALVIFRSKSDSWMTILTSFTLVTFGAVITQSLDILMSHPVLHWPARLVYAGGLASFLTFIYVFPNGRFTPWWTGVGALVYAVWMLASYLFPTSPVSLLTWPAWPSFIVQLGWYVSSALIQQYRIKHVYSPIEQQQAKWVVAGLIGALFGFVVMGIWNLMPPPDQASVTYLLYASAASAISKLCITMVPLAIGLSIMHYRLWDVDLLINRAMVYGLVTGLLGGGYFALVFVFQRIFQWLLGRRSDAVIIASTLIIASLFRPMRRRVQDFIDRRFYREQVDFRRAFTSFAREVRAIIELPELLRVLVSRVTDLLHIAHGAVFLRDADGAFRLAEASNLPVGGDVQLPREVLMFFDRLQEGNIVSLSGDATFSLLVPLNAPRSGAAQQSMIGVLALGPRLSGQDYTRDDRTLLMGLADQAGAAIYVARLIAEKQAEAQQKEAAERHLEAYRNSPLGRAEAMAQQLMERPDNAFIELHALAQTGGNDPEAASLLGNLQQVLAHRVNEPDKVDLSLWLAGLAEGLNYLYTSQVSPELLTVGLRTLITVLSAASPSGAGRWTIKGSDEALALYRICQAALDANSISQITAVDLSSSSTCLAELAHSVTELHPVMDALNACERVDNSPDKLAYLASAVERLRRADSAARARLRGADRSLVRRVIESWLAVVTGAMGELQTRAQLVCQLLTRHTWVGDVISLALGVRNDGRGAALGVRVTLTPAPEYTVLDGTRDIGKLSPGEEEQVDMRVHLREPGRGQFRARFVIQYADPRGPDQIEHYADAVYLLEAEGEFQFIPNPYVVGTPLQTGSPLFFGREDVVAFIHDNLSAAHRNNLVLIGQRRTGKTSLLKQLPARLSQDYLPVYLDGQSLALDPGLSNFFLTLATEITFALEDHGFSIEPPEPDEFADAPAATFERKFLARVRQAIGQRHVLLLLDEFEELEASVQRGSLDASIFAFLRHLVQHAPDLSVIFCGTHRLEELTADYWSVLFNISLYRHIAYLERAEATRLIQEPVAEYGMRYDDLALDKMWRVTAGHPYFLQLLCHSLVNQHNLSGRQAGKAQRNYVTVADVNAALDEILASGEAHFVYLWSGSTAVERLTLTALSRMMPLTGRVTPMQVMDYLTERGISVERQQVSEALHHLALRDILEANTQSDPLGEAYRWELGLLGLWVEKYKSLSRVVDEMQA